MQESLKTANDRLSPMLAKAEANEIPSTANGISYLEMKYNLMMQYCSNLTFFILLKVEGAQSLDSHPVVARLVHIKTLIEKLKPLDLKLAY